MKQFIKDLWKQPLTNREYVLLTAFVIFALIIAI